jgi:hypothetical protein
MQENSLQAGQRLQGNPLESHLRTFVTSLLDHSYADATVHDKLSLLHRAGQCLRGFRNAPAVSRLSPRAWFPLKSRFLTVRPGLTL